MFDASAYIADKNNKQLQDIIEFGADLATPEERNAAKMAAQQRLSSGAAGPQHKEGWSGVEHRHHDALQQGLLTRPQQEQLFRTNGKRLGINSGELTGTSAQAWQDSQRPDPLSLGGPVMPAASGPSITLPDGSSSTFNGGSQAATPTATLPGGSQSAWHGGSQGAQAQGERNRPPGYSEAVQQQVQQRQEAVMQIPEFQQLQQAVASLQGREPTPEEMAQLEQLEQAVMRSQAFQQFELLVRDTTGQGLLQQVASA